MLIAARAAVNTRLVRKFGNRAGAGQRLIILVIGVFIRVVVIRVVGVRKQLPVSQISRRVFPFQLLGANESGQFVSSVLDKEAEYGMNLSDFDIEQQGVLRCDWDCGAGDCKVYWIALWVGGDK
ncbi:hypothetical protein FB451DRAFT_1183593 [Mycena latifolia]|nr:hypothetical protein FB451DRAFT_1183593 [Mycena latifolia]